MKKKAFEITTGADLRESRALGSVRSKLFGVAASLLFCALAVPASAGTTTLCPSAATVGGFGETSSDVAGPLDGTCGSNSAVQIGLSDSTNYGKLQFNSGMTGYPAGLTLGGAEGASASVSLTGAGQPYYLLDFTDGSDSLGQSAAGDQILFIEFQPTTVTANTLAFDPATTLFNLYDNSTNAYLQGGQADARTLDTWLADFSDLGNESLDGIWLGEGLDASNTGAESFTVNSLDVTTAAVPEPSALALLGAGLLGFIGFAGIRRRRTATAA